jgi:Mg2+ and Co2+ transporter CorA
VLAPLSELLSETASLLETYFNVTNFTASEATGRLNHSAAVLSRLGLLFLPVSLMTAYFSIQIQDLAGVYSVADYWAAFGVVTGLSVVVVLFLGGPLVRWIEASAEGVRGLVSVGRRIK